MGLRTMAFKEYALINILLAMVYRTWLIEYILKHKKLNLLKVFILWDKDSF